jgi:hypothetical protein
MSVAEILHQIEALSTEDRLELTDKLIELAEADAPGSLCPPMSDAERVRFEEMLKQRPTLGAELGEKITRMQAGESMDWEEVKVLLRLSSKPGL